MKIKINEHQEKLLHKLFINEAMRNEFSFETLKQLNSFSARAKYCKEYLGNPIGNGSSRLVFQIDDKRVLKLAKNAKGIAQNDAEYDPIRQSHYEELFPIVFADESDTDNYYFLVSEFVLPAKEKDFLQVYGLDFNTWCTFINGIAACYKPKGMHFYPTPMSGDEIGQLIDSNEELYKPWYDYMTDFTPPSGDMIRVANYGIVKRYNDTYIVLLDSGLSENVWNTYYKRR